MAKPKLTATMPDGTVDTRRTDREYVSVVAVETRNAYYHAAAQSRVNEAQADLAHWQGLLDGTIEPSEAVGRRPRRSS